MFDSLSIISRTITVILYAGLLNKKLSSLNALGQQLLIFRKNLAIYYFYPPPKEVEDRGYGVSLTSVCLFICFQSISRLLHRSHGSWFSTRFPDLLITLSIRRIFHFLLLLQTYIKITIFNGCAILNFSQILQEATNFPHVRSAVRRNDHRVNLLSSCMCILGVMTLTYFLTYIYGPK